ncbi:hypothetical protein ACSBR1_009502 [Camellia fascicularis]
MASNGQKEKMGDDALTGSDAPIDLDIEGDNHNTETYEQGQKERNVGQTGDASRKPDQSRYYKEDDLQPPFPLHDTPVPAINTQKGGQIPVAPQHDRSRRHSHQTSREVGRGESRREESQRTHHTREADPKEHRHVQGQVLCFNTPNKERSKRTHNDAESSIPKRLKSRDSRAPGRSKEDLRDYLNRK